MRRISVICLLGQLHLLRFLAPTANMPSLPAKHDYCSRIHWINKETNLRGMQGGRSPRPTASCVTAVCQALRYSVDMAMPIDTSEPSAEVWHFLYPFIRAYNAAVFTMPQFVPPDPKTPRIEFIPPAIDPISARNRSLPKYLCREKVAEFGIDLSRPLMIQAGISHFN